MYVNIAIIFVTMFLKALSAQDCSPNFTRTDTNEYKLLQEPVAALAEIDTATGKIQSIIFENCKADVFSMSFTEDLSALKKLIIKNCSMELLPASIFHNLPSLKELVIFKNKITKIDSDAFEGMGNLKCLNLSENSLENSLPMALYYLGNVKVTVKNNMVMQVSEDAQDLHDFFNKLKESLNI